MVYICDYYVFLLDSAGLQPPYGSGKGLSTCLYLLGTVRIWRDKCSSPSPRHFKAVPCCVVLDSPLNLSGLCISFHSLPPDNLQTDRKKDRRRVLKGMNEDNMKSYKWELMAASCNLGKVRNTRGEISLLMGTQTPTWVNDN